MSIEIIPIFKKRQTPIRDYRAEKRIFLHRALFSFMGIILLVGILFTNLYNLQVTHFNEYKTRSNDNRIKVIPVAPNRGLIFDRNGIILAENKPVYNLEITPLKTKDLQETVNELTKLMELTEDQVAKFEKDRHRSRRFKATTIKSQLTEEEVARFAVNSHRFSGVEVKAYLKRFYPYGAVLTHMLGYVAKINDKDIKNLAEEDKLANYKATHDIGKLGLEKYYENDLHGTIGYQKVEVNSRGRIIRTLEYLPPIPGKDLVLNVDIKLQIYVTKLIKNKRGAAVVLNPQDSSILAMVSTPSYDPNLFVHGISSKAYNKLLTDPDRPLVNRVTLGIYPPASIVKPAIAVAALSENVITPETTRYDPGYWHIPNSTTRPFRDWLPWGHGAVNVLNSLEESVDTFYYQIAFDMGIDRISKWMRNFGYGEYTGIDIGEESKANMPTREWKRARYNKPWYQGDTIPVGIGQGYWTATPIQLAKVLAVIVNDGIVRPPHLVNEIITDNGVEQIKLTPYPPVTGVKQAYWDIAKEGMFRVNHGKKGTARRSFMTSKYLTAGKSGTAQVFGLAENEKYDANEIDERLRDHALYVAFAPFKDPKVALSIVLENAGGGSSNGAPIARRIFDFLLLPKDEQNKDEKETD